MEVLEALDERGVSIELPGYDPEQPQLDAGPLEVGATAGSRFSGYKPTVIHPSVVQAVSLVMAAARVGGPEEGQRASAVASKEPNGNEACDDRREDTEEPVGSSAVLGKEAAEQTTTKDPAPAPTTGEGTTTEEAAALVTRDHPGTVPTTGMGETTGPAAMGDPGTRPGTDVETATEGAAMPVEPDNPGTNLTTRMEVDPDSTPSGNPGLEQPTGEKAGAGEGPRLVLKRISVQDYQVRTPKKPGEDPTGATATGDSRDSRPTADSEAPPRKVSAEDQRAGGPTKATGARPGQERQAGHRPRSRRAVCAATSTTDIQGTIESVTTATSARRAKVVETATSPIHESNEDLVSKERGATDAELWEAVRHVILWMNGLPGKEAFQDEAEARARIVLECGILGIEAKHLEIMVTAANECGVLHFTYGDGMSRYELWRRKIQAGIRWVLSRMELAGYSPIEIIREMPAHCSLLHFTDRESKVMVYILDQLFPDRRPLKRRLSRRPDTEFPAQDESAQFSSETSSSSSDEAE